MIRLEVGIELIPETGWIAEDPDSRDQDGEAHRAKEHVHQRADSKKQIKAHVSSSIRVQ